MSFSTLVRPLASRSRALLMEQQSVGARHRGCGIRAQRVQSPLQARKLRHGPFFGHHDGGWWFELRRLLFIVMFVLLEAEGTNAHAASPDELSQDIQWKVGSISFRGNKALSGTELSKAMQTKTRPAYLFWRKRPDFGGDT